MTGNEARRFLIAAGTEDYEDGDRLASVPDDLRKIAEFFKTVGYVEQLPHLRLNPISSALRGALSEWLNAPDRQTSDTAVIYYSGHGDSQASYFYLLTADSKENRYADTALRADFVLEALGEMPAVRRLLVILDACYAGHGAFNAADVAARMSPWQNFNADDEGIWVVAAASPKQEAEERLFAEAFLEAAELLQQTTGTLQPYVGLEALIWQINTILKRRGKQQRASWIPATQARGLAPFIPNSRYDPDALANIDLETRDWLRSRHAAELAEHWGPKARGVEVAAQAGWYFTGRRAALAELTKWIADPASDTRVRVVTGDPGSGKSAVLGRLITLADTTWAPKPPELPVDPRSVPPVGSIAVALLARGKTTGDLLAELAASFGIAPGAELADAMSRPPSFIVVIDSLDEAADPLEVVDKVILPLLGAASPGRGPRLLVATRRYQQLLDSLPEAHARVTVDLDDETYHDEIDTVDYVTKILLATDDPRSPTPYRGEPDLARTVAAQVAAIAGRSFLIAQIAARTLARSPEAFDAAEVSANRQWWRDVGTAFDRDLDRYGQKAHQIRDLLTPLAWAQGAGLPRELWPALATALSEKRSYAEPDVTWLLEQAGCYLVETLENDRSVYRLYHEQFAERLREARNPRQAHMLIAAALLRHVPAVADGRREWLGATPYIRDHLATHAGRAGVLDPLASDPGFLLAADPVRLLPELATVTSRNARKAASAFEATQHILPGQPHGQAAAQLDLAARASGATKLANKIGSLPFQRPWIIDWGHWARPDRHVLLGGRAERIRAVATTTLDDAAVAIVGDSDGTLRIWDLRTGTPRGKPIRRHHGGINAISTGQVAGVPIAVTGGRDGTVRVWDLRTGTARGEPMRGHSGEIDAVATGQMDATPVAVTGGRDGNVRVWNLRTGSARGTSFRGHQGGVLAVAAGHVDGTPVAVTGGRDGTVGIWDLRSGYARTNRLHGHAGGVFAVSTVEVGGRPLAVTGGSDGTVRVWDLRTGAAHGTPMRGHSSGVFALATGRLGPIPVAVTGGRDGTVRIWDLRFGRARGNPLRGHTGRVFAVTIAEVNGGPVAVTGGSDGTIRAWNLQAWTTPGVPQRRHGHGIAAVATWRANGTPVAITGDRDGTVRVLDLRSGAARGNPMGGDAGSISAVTAWEVDGLPVAITASSDGAIQVWNLSDSAIHGHRLRGHAGEVEAIAAGQLGNIPVAVTGGSDGIVRIWNVRAGAVHGQPIRGHAGEVFAVATAEVDGVLLAVTGGRDGTVRVWNLRTGGPHGNLMRGHTGEVFAVATGQLGHIPVAVTGGRDGSLRVWDLKMAAAHGDPIPSHSGAIKAIALGEIGGVLMVVSGDDKGSISIRSLEHNKLHSVRFDALADITSIAFSRDVGWVTVTKDGSLFAWHTTSESRLIRG